MSSLVSQVVSLLHMTAVLRSLLDAFYHTVGFFFHVYLWPNLSTPMLGAVLLTAYSYVYLILSGEQ